VHGSACRHIESLSGKLLTKSSHDVAPKPAFEKTFGRVFKRAESGSTSPHINAQEIALVFIIMAQGTMFNIEMPNCDSSAKEWLRLSERALVKGEFLSNNTLAGLQTLVSSTISTNQFCSMANVAAFNGSSPIVRNQPA